MDFSRDEAMIAQAKEMALSRMSAAAGELREMADEIERRIRRSGAAPARSRGEPGGPVSVQATVQSLGEMAYLMGQLSNQIAKAGERAASQIESAGSHLKSAIEIASASINEEREAMSARIRELEARVAELEDPEADSSDEGLTVRPGM